MNNEDLLNKKIIAIGSDINGMTIMLDDGKEYLLTYSYFPDGTFKDYHFEPIYTHEEHKCPSCKKPMTITSQIQETLNDKIQIRFASCDKCEEYHDL